MTKLEAIVQPNKFEAVKDALIALGVEGLVAYSPSFKAGVVYSSRNLQQIRMQPKAGNAS